MTVLGGLESFPYSSVYNHFKQNLFFADLMQQLKKKKSRSGIFPSSKVHLNKPIQHFCHLGGKF